MRRCVNLIYVRDSGYHAWVDEKQSEDVACCKFVHAVKGNGCMDVVFGYARDQTEEKRKETR